MNESTASAPVISLTDIHKSYGPETVLSGVSLTVQRGEIFGIAGPNGAGKTTLGECVTGLREPAVGSIEVLGRNPRAERRALLEDVGARLRESSMPGELRVAEALLTGAAINLVRIDAHLTGTPHTRTRTSHLAAFRPAGRIQRGETENQTRVNQQHQRRGRARRAAANAPGSRPAPGSA